jgi:anti-sigma regulatory factor (Ser/Thr protein kinase)
VHDPHPMEKHRQPATTARAATSPPWESTPTGLRSQWRLDADFRSVSAMRWWLRAFLGQARGLAVEEIEDLVLVACEAANNAVEHAQQPSAPFFDVFTEIDLGAVTIAIHDHGKWRPQSPPGDRGRGLSIMHALADTTVTASANGTTVTIRRQPGEREALADV